jgi:hypothetical protein
MTIVIETGTIVTGANSYATVADLVGYASARGDTLPASTAEKERLLIKAMDYLQLLAYKGNRVSATQPLDWPRFGVEIEGWPLSSTEIPRQLVQAQCVLAIEYAAQDLMPTTEAHHAGAIASQSVGGVSVSYAGNGGMSSNKVPVVAKAAALLAVLTTKANLQLVRT